MPVLEVNEDNQKLELPSYKALPEPDRAWVVLDVSDQTAQDILKASGNNTEVEVTVLMLVKRIKEWNFTDAEGKTLPIDFENVSKLKTEDYKFLVTALRNQPEGLSDDAKKDLSPGSQQEPAAPAPTPTR